MRSTAAGSRRTVVVALATNLGVAVAKLFAALLTGSSANIVIGVLLGFVAFQLAARNGNILIGSQVSASLRAEVREKLVAQTGIVAVTELLVTFIGPRTAWVVARVAIDDSLSGASVGKLVRGAEDVLRRDLPFVARVDLVPCGFAPVRG